MFFWELFDTCSFSESQFPLKSDPPTQPAASPQLAPVPRSAASPWFLSDCRLTGLVVLFDCFFNSMVVRVPCSLISWHFWLLIDFRLVVILLLVV